MNEPCIPGVVWYKSDKWKRQRHSTLQQRARQGSASNQSKHQAQYGMTVLILDEAKLNAKEAQTHELCTQETPNWYPFLLLFHNHRGHEQIIPMDVPFNEIQQIMQFDQPEILAKGFACTIKTPFGYAKLKVLMQFAVAPNHTRCYLNSVDDILFIKLSESIINIPLPQGKGCRIVDADQVVHVPGD